MDRRCVRRVAGKRNAGGEPAGLCVGRRMEMVLGVLGRLFAGGVCFGLGSVLSGREPFLLFEPQFGRKGCGNSEVGTR